MSGEPKFYAVGDREELYATDPDEAVEEYLEYVWTDAPPGDLPTTVRVQGYAPRLISADCWFFGRMIEDLIEELDNEYSGPDDQTNYELSDKAKQLFDAFKAQVIAEYPVWQFEQVGEVVEVDLAPYIARKMEDMSDV